MTQGAAGARSPAGGVSGCSPPCPYLVFPLHAADADVVLVRAPRQLLEGGTKPSVGLGRSQETPWCPPPPNTRGLGTHPVVAQLPGTGGLQADAVDVVPGEGEMGVTTLWLRCWRHPQDVPPREACWGGGAGSAAVPLPREGLGAGVGDEHHRGRDSPTILSPPSSPRRILGCSRAHSGVPPQQRGLGWVLGAHPLGGWLWGAALQTCPR